MGVESDELFGGLRRPGADVSLLRLRYDSPLSPILYKDHGSEWSFGLKGVPPGDHRACKIDVHSSEPSPQSTRSVRCAVTYHPLPPPLPKD